MEIADSRASGASPGVRKSLRRFKSTPEYAELLKGVVARREVPSMSALERRRLRLDRILANLELEAIQQGKPLSEYTGILALHDPLRGLIDEVPE